MDLYNIDVRVNACNPIYLHRIYMHLHEYQCVHYKHTHTHTHNTHTHTPSHTTYNRAGVCCCGGGGIISIAAATCNSCRTTSMLNESHTLTFLQKSIRRSDCFSALFDNMKLWPFHFSQPPRREKITEIPTGFNAALIF